MRLLQLAAVLAAVAPAAVRAVELTSETFKSSIAHGQWSVALLHTLNPPFDPGRIGTGLTILCFLPYRLVEHYSPQCAYLFLD